MIDPELRAALVDRYAEAAVGYEVTKAEAERLVAQWRWSRGLSWWDDPRPLAAERQGERRGRLLRSRPRSRFRDQDQVGLDAGSRPVVVRVHDGLGDLTDERFLMRVKDRVERVRYRSPSAIGPAELVNLLWVLFDSEGRPEAAHTCWASGRVASEHYDYADDGRLLGIEQTADPHPDFPEVQDWRQLTSPVYGDSGDLIAVDEESDWNGRRDRRRVWRPPLDKRRLAGWKAAAEDGLRREVLRVVAAARPAEPLAAVGLLYSAQSILPPSVGLLPASERDGFVAAHGDRDVAPYLWNPAEWSWFDTPSLSLAGDQELVGVMEELVLEWQMALDHEPGRRLLNRVSKRLNEIEWPVATASDFVVFASDLELTETPGNLRTALPTERLRDLRRRGWLLEDA